MRSATIGALFVLLLAGCAKQAAETTETDPAAESAESAPVVASVKYAAGEKLTFAVPDMHCPFACYPAVKETLEGLDGVQTVELVPQEKEGVIDDRRVIVTLDGELDSATAITALAKAGFPDSTVEDQP
jgi:copper chaperone CopZ